ncbi:MAG TPA: hypothetical protein PKN13_09480 [Accumulibacter sp.]|nr:hypothetical protein [Accumulibacter sp.]HMW18063.1 hypothetical protein [Accumulibacter sp.]HMY06673.1 hypothetical protein [Accumulibacter sp.]HNC18155.1 hypothetical protein [Accumulibacter sp.]HND80702.1 hypothetical protein [Accumulibacter sp.]
MNGNDAGLWSNKEFTHPKVNGLKNSGNPFRAGTPFRQWLKNVDPGKRKPLVGKLPVSNPTTL